jgi:hypothetical protein
MKIASFEISDGACVPEHPNIFGVLKRWRQHVLPKHWYATGRLHSTITQRKTTI